VPDFSGFSSPFIDRLDDPAVEALMIPFTVVINQVSVDRLAKMGFAEKDQPAGHLPLKGTDEPFDMGIAVGRARRSQNGLHARLF
jgi:hypothetical protein